MFMKYVTFVETNVEMNNKQQQTLKNKIVILSKKKIPKRGLEKTQYKYHNHHKKYGEFCSEIHTQRVYKLSQFHPTRSH